MHNAHNDDDPQHLLHRLHAVQAEQRYISTDAILSLSKELKLPISQITAVVDFYSFFHRSPRGVYHLLFSQCTSCGDAALMQWLCQRLGVQLGKIRDDGNVTIEGTSCIGMCDQGPALLINDRVIAQLNRQRLEQIAQRIEAGTALEAWPTDWFVVNNPVRKKGLILNDILAPGAALQQVLTQGPEAMLEVIKESGLRGRGGAGFSTGLKWQLCRDAEAKQRYVVCNADEGEPGTFKDRLLLSHHADALIEGMTLCARVIGASEGYIYVRGEYRYLLASLQTVLNQRRQSGLLGRGILGVEHFDFDIQIIVGAGAYVCGEESALLESLEQKPGVPRLRPPFPVTQGYLGQPTVVNNVETLVAAAHIAQHDAPWFKQHGSAQSSGSKLLSISGDCAEPGIYEYDFGVSLAQILQDCGAQTVQAVQLSGPSGRLLAPADFHRILGFEDLACGGSLMIYHQQRDLLDAVQNFSHFFAHESCGFCTPCRVGSSLLRNRIDKIHAGHGTALDVAEVQQLGVLMQRRSHCGLGQTAANPLLNLLESFPDVMNKRLLQQTFEPHFDLDAALSEARQLSHRDDQEAHLS